MTGAHKERLSPSSSRSDDLRKCGPAVWADAFDIGFQWQESCGCRIRRGLQQASAW